MPVQLFNRVFNTNIYIFTSLDVTKNNMKIQLNNILEYFEIRNEFSTQLSHCFLLCHYSINNRGVSYWRGKHQMERTLSCFNEELSLYLTYTLPLYSLKICKDCY